LCRQQDESGLRRSETPDTVSRANLRRLTEPIETDSEPTKRPFSNANLHKPKFVSPTNGRPRKDIRWRSVQIRGNGLRATQYEPRRESYRCDAQLRKVCITWRVVDRQTSAQSLPPLPKEHCQPTGFPKDTPTVRPCTPAHSRTRFISLSRELRLPRNPHEPIDSERFIATTSDGQCTSEKVDHPGRSPPEGREPLDSELPRAGTPLDRPPKETPGLRTPFSEESEVHQRRHTPTGLRVPAYRGDPNQSTIPKELSRCLSKAQPTLLGPSESPTPPRDTEVTRMSRGRPADHRLPHSTVRITPKGLSDRALRPA